MTVNMVHVAETLKNELVEDEPLRFEDQTFEATDTFITGDEPATYQFFYPLSLYQCQDTAVTNVSFS